VCFHVFDFFSFDGVGSNLVWHNNFHFGGPSQCFKKINCVHVFMCDFVNFDRVVTTPFVSKTLTLVTLLGSL